MENNSNGLSTLVKCRFFIGNISVEIPLLKKYWLYIVNICNETNYSTYIGNISNEIEE